MAENFLGQIAEYDNNNEADFTPIDKTQHNRKNSRGKVIHTACLVARPRKNTPAVIMEADCQGSEDVAFSINNNDTKSELHEGDYGIQNPLNKKIKIITGENKVYINAGSTTIQVLEDGDVLIDSNGKFSVDANGEILQKAGNSQISIAKDGTISMKSGGTNIANFTQASINFLVPVNMVTGSAINGKLIAVVGGDIDVISKKIISSGQ